MRGADFFDTKVLLYRFDARGARRCNVGHALLASAQRDGTDIISANSCASKTLSSKPRASSADETPS